MHVLESDIRIINDRLMDDISKNIFANRLAYSATGDNYYLRQIISSIPEYHSFYRSIDTDKEIVLFGVGKWGKWILDTFDDIKWDYCTDNRIEDNRIVFCNIPLISVEELINHHKDAFVVVSSKYHYKEIYAQLVEAGFKEKQICLFGKLAKGAEKGIYFDSCLGRPCNREVFADVGGGTTVRHRLILLIGQT